MIEVGTYEAKTRLSELVDEALKGETVVITRHGRPVARLVADEAARRSRVEATIEAIRGLRSRQENVPVEDLVAMKHDGHRF